MASAQLDKLWDQWMQSLSQSYVRTLDLLEANKPDEARQEFRAGMVWTVKKLFAEAEQTYPVRFSKIDEWCGWTRSLYVMTRRAEQAFDKGDYETAKARLQEIRQHFDFLHRQAGYLRANDDIYAFVAALDAGHPAPDTLKAALKDLREAAPSTKAKADGDAYLKARDAWLAQVEPTLAQPALSDADVQRLRSATDAFYRAYGTAFE